MLFSLYFFTSCSVELKANRKIDKAIMLTSPKHVIEYVTSKYGSSYLENKIDTIVDTIIVKGVKIDTMFITKTKDTVIFQKDGTDVKIIRLYDTIYANIKTKTDTIYSVKTFTKYVVVKNNNATKYWLKDIYSNLWILILLIIFVAIILVLIKSIKNLKP
jgi:pyridoxine 5'-phosphate synthase PdxJ